MSKRDVIKLDETTKDTLIELALDYEIITRADVESFEKIYNEYDKKYINETLHRCAWWWFNQDNSSIGNRINGRYRKLRTKHEKLICERIKKRLKK